MNVHNNCIEIEIDHWLAPQVSSSLWKKFEGGASSPNLHVLFCLANSSPQTSLHFGQMIVPRCSHPPDLMRMGISWPEWKHSNE